MVLTFCKKNEEKYKRFEMTIGDNFIYPSDDDIIAQYRIMEAIDRPIVGDIVKVKGGFYKVCHTTVDYDLKEIFAVVE